MNGLVLILIVIVIFIIAYATYGAWLAKKWGIDASRTAPSHQLKDNVDYVPTRNYVVLGHHFASIAGAGPIVGPIAAAFFGWIPVMLWILIGSIFFGGVHDFGALFASIRHDGKSIGEIIHKNIGDSGKKLFTIFAWLTLVLVIAAFNNIVAATFAGNGAVATTSIYFIALAIVFGLIVNKNNIHLGVATVVGVILLFIGIWIGNAFPILLSKETWMILLMVYILIAAIAPVWILLQPRDYLNSFLLYAMIAGAILGLALYRPTIQIPAFTGFVVNGKWMFPMLFVIVACGAISGFHSLVSSGTTSKQLDNETDARKIGYGSMLIEGTLASIALITIGFITADKAAELGSPIAVFSNGLGTFMTSFGIDYAVGNSFVALAISAFALTTLDTTARLGRFLFQEFFSSSNQNSMATNKYFATAVTVIAGGGLGFLGYQKVWPVFGSANQLLAALALLAVAAYLKHIGKSNKMLVIPMVIMFAVTLTALLFLIRDNIVTNNILLVIVAAILFVLAIVLIVISYKSLSKKDYTIAK
ncbi:MAG: carbon starvation protein A [Clostridia bacterium]|nr:carbon starvation protein A [Clostridia bacterium]